jgi:LDH2 family malate/lactate/ureidoglycolate dehydrogenase
MPRHPPAALQDFATALLGRAGLDVPHARALADTLIAADLLGHGSHGIRLLPRYLDEVRDGRMARSGAPEIVKDNGGSLLFDGGMLPGPVVVKHAVELALARLSAYGAITAVIRRSSHIACLGAYLEMATSRGAMMMIASSNPWAKIIAPFGGSRPVYSPNPIAFGIPTEADPILIDFSTSMIAANACQEYRSRGELLPGAYLLDSQGQPTRDPAVLTADPPGAIMPLGGTELGYKGFGLGLMVEALTAGLGGFGRSDSPQASSNAVLVYVLDPDAFGGRAFLMREAGWLAAACREAAVAPDQKVRLPGERALAHRRAALAEGLDVDSRLMDGLVRRAEVFGVSLPAALDVAAIRRG